MQIISNYLFSASCNTTPNLFSFVLIAKVSLFLSLLQYVTNQVSPTIPLSKNSNWEELSLHMWSNPFFKENMLKFCF